MGRINLDGIVQFQKLLMQTVVHHSRHHLGRVTFAACEIRATHIANKKRIACQNLLRLIGNGGINDKQADAFRCVTRGFHNP